MTNEPPTPQPGELLRLPEELAVLAERDAVVRAWVAHHDARTLEQAHTGAPDGMLGGWTLGVKDVIDTADFGTERGSPIYRGRRTDNDAACVAMARRAGAVVIGKTTTTEFALFTPAATTNPHDATRTPGGSSSGSAAAVAAGMVRAAFGTQTVGSVIRPAAYCGVVGFKPTHGLVPLAGVGSLAPSFDTVGWFTRDVADTATVLQALSGIEAGSTAADRAPRIGVYRSHQWGSADPETEIALVEAATRLDAAGFEVTEREPLRHLDGVFEAADTVLHHEVARVFAWERDHHWDLISPLLQRMLGNADRVDAAVLVEARLLLDQATHAHTEYLRAEGLDAIVTPSAPGVAPPIETTGNSVFNRTWTALGVPCVHLPTGSGPLGLPLGIQLTGHRWGDAALLHVASRAERALEASP